jgi:bifunctional DNA-binding transcriptional regulator/antitoxin component of YhaV-PrlF toxin-antitoxin module
MLRLVAFEPMTVTLKDNTRLVVPPSVQRRARLRTGAKLECRATPGIITIISKPPAAADEYTQEQRRIIDARLALADQDVKKSRVYGPFPAKEATAFLRAELRARAKKAKRSR